MADKDALGGPTEASEDREALVFRYDRKARLARAPESLQKIYAERASGKKKGFFATLMANKGLLILFATIVLALVFIYALPFLHKLSPGEGGSVAVLVAGRKAVLEASWADGTAFGILRLGPPEQEVEPGELRLRISADGKGSTERTFILSGRKAAEVLRFSLSAEAPGDLECLIDEGGRMTALSARMNGGER